MREGTTRWMTHTNMWMIHHDCMKQKTVVATAPSATGGEGTIAIVRTTEVASSTHKKKGALRKRKKTLDVESAKGSRMKALKALCTRKRFSDPREETFGCPRGDIPLQMPVRGYSDASERPKSPRHTFDKTNATNSLIGKCGDGL
jgi:hypothetical protein